MAHPPDEAFFSQYKRRLCPPQAQPVVAEAPFADAELEPAVCRRRFHQFQLLYPGQPPR